MTVDDTSKNTEPNVALENKGSVSKSFEKVWETAFGSVWNPIVAGVFSNIPDYGPANAMSLSAISGYAGSRRMRELTNSISNELLQVDETKIEKSYFKTEEFLDTFRRVLENTIRTRDSTKIRLYARILARTPILDYADFRHTAEDFLLILLELSPADPHLARAVFNQQKDLPKEFINIEQDELRHVKDSGWDNLRLNGRRFRTGSDRRRGS